MSGTISPTALALMLASQGGGNTGYGSNTGMPFGFGTNVNPYASLTPLQQAMMNASLTNQGLSGQSNLSALSPWFGLGGGSMTGGGMTGLGY